MAATNLWDNASLIRDAVSPAFYLADSGPRTIQFTGTFSEQPGGFLIEIERATEADDDKRYARVAVMDDTLLSVMPTEFETEWHHGGPSGPTVVSHISVGPRVSRDRSQAFKFVWSGSVQGPSYVRLRLRHLTNSNVKVTAYVEEIIT